MGMEGGISDTRTVFKRGVDAAISGVSQSQLGCELIQILTRRYPGFIGQQSACEGFVYMIDALALEVVFEHRYVVTTKCQQCKHVSKQEDIGVHYELFDMKEGVINEKMLLDRVLGGKMDIKDYNCSKCRGRGSAEQERKLIFLPEYLVILLQKYSGKTNVLLPESIRLPVGGGGGTTYKVIAQIDHSGTTGGGHYRCHIRRGTGTGGGENRVYICDDSNVTQTTGFSINPQTYILFYEAERSV